MPWNGSQGLPFTRSSVLANAPESSGVYVLFNPNSNVYVGESGNIRERLLQHLTNETNVCVVRSKPQYFAFELSYPMLRVARQNALILELRATCNMRLG